MSHRTQIILEDWQVEPLREAARRMKTSLSGVIRYLVTERFGIKKKAFKKDPLFDVIGLIKGGGKPVGRMHDQILYHRGRTL